MTLQLKIEVLKSKKKLQKNETQSNLVSNVLEVTHFTIVMLGDLETNKTSLKICFVPGFSHADASAMTPALTAGGLHFDHENKNQTD